MLPRRLFNIVKWVIITLVVITAGKYLINELILNSKDITSLITMDKYTLEQSLGITLTPNQEKIKQIFIHTDSVITAYSDKDNGISLIYLDGVPCGIHIDNHKYNMYGIKIGTTDLSMERKITYPFEQAYFYDDGKSVTTFNFFFNEKNDDCLILTVNDVTNRVVAITYYNNLQKAMENLSF